MRPERLDAGRGELPRQPNNTNGPAAPLRGLSAPPPPSDPPLLSLCRDPPPVLNPHVTTITTERVAQHPDANSGNSALSVRGAAAFPSAGGDRLGATKHLVRTWRDHYSILQPDAPGQWRTRRGPQPRRHRPPPAEELRRLRVSEHWSLRELAEHYRVHPHTLSRWLDDYNIVRGRRGGRLHGVSVAELVDRYQSSDLTVAELASSGWGWDATSACARAFRAAGVDIDRSRRPPPPPSQRAGAAVGGATVCRRRVAAVAHR